MRRLVVGVDGTEAARVALDWAADTVGLHGFLHAIVAVDPKVEFVVDLVTGDPTTFLESVFRDLDSSWTQAARARVGGLTADLVERGAPDALAAAAAEFRADAIVVGAHVTHRGVPKRIGATTKDLLRKLDVPLIVVPAVSRSGLGEGAAAGPIVVGVGRGDATEAAVRWAADLADERNRGVVLVHATGDGPVFQADGVLDLLSFELHPDQREEWLRSDLARFADQVQELSEHDLAIAVASPTGYSALRLAEASEVAALLVIGQHRSKLTLGHRTAQPLRHLLTHARCPIAVVPEWAASEPLGSAEPDHVT